MRKLLALVVFALPAFVDGMPRKSCSPHLEVLSVTSRGRDANYLYSAWKLSENARLVAISPGARFIVEGFDSATMNRVTVRYEVRDLIRAEILAEFSAAHQRDDSYAFQFFSADELGISWREATSTSDSQSRERLAERFNLMTGDRRKIPLPHMYGSISELVRAEEIARENWRAFVKDTGQASSLKLVVQPKGDDAVQDRFEGTLHTKTPFDSRLVDSIELSATLNHAVLYVSSGRIKGYHLFDLRSGQWMRHFKPRWTYFNGRSADQTRLKLLSGSGDFIALDDQILDINTLSSAAHRWVALEGKSIVYSWFEGDDLIVVTDDELISLRRSDRDGGRVLLDLSEVYLR